MRKWFTANELAGLPGLPGTERGVLKLAKREGWEGQRRLGSKAVEYSFAALPKESQSALLVRLVADQQSAPSQQLVPAQANLAPKRDAISASRLTDDQRNVMSARIAFVREIERMSGMVSQQRAIETLVALARDGQLSPYLSGKAAQANDRKTAERTLSERTLKRWLSDYRNGGEVALAPARRKPDMGVPDWAQAFLRHFQRPTKPSVEAAYAEYAAKCEGNRPSIHQVRRFLDKLSPEAREQGRRSPQELKALQGFKRRDTKNLMPGDVYTADGHKFDAEVINPRTGKPYRPETTTVLDVATRRAMGISIGEAESTVGVLDALRDAIQRGGMFAIFYVDNGSGFANDTVREVVDRLGGTMTHALPYNSQARGLVERAHQSIWVTAAKKLTSYIGADMDKHAGTAVHRISRKQLRESGSTRLIPTFAEFIAGVEYELEQYNNRPHRGLAKIRDPQSGKPRHMSPNEAWQAAIEDGWEPMMAPAELVQDLLRPQVVRPTRRGEVTWANQRYFLQDLVALHQEEVRVAYDVRDASRVWVRTLEGVLIGEALLDGNASDYMPKTMLEQAYERREQGQMKRSINKLETLTGRRVELIATTDAPSRELAPEQLADARQTALELIADEPAFVLPDDDMARYRLWNRLAARRDAGQALSAAEAAWLESYADNPNLESIRRTFEFVATTA
ncbi:DDE-type integrase/transposase/recombinase [Pseudomonas nitroreducens]|uniref:DDE-type integrase/transposase/recombinase n=1 Tax=Pseudomonas nitroreducens TaxID=46680 RepID=A0A5R8ZWH1_PSENT|nr:DNA-binding protein [Pseudomonas nitroreducens]TLP70783.1 DDE-type integrase/transposase/recombinase [Pseudomonas nitroreducens]